MSSLEEFRKHFMRSSVNFPTNLAVPGDDISGNETERGQQQHRDHKVSRAMGHAVAAIFDPLRILEAQLGQIVQNARVIEDALKGAARTFDELGTFHARMTQLEEAYQALRQFETALEPKARDELRQHFDSIGTIFNEHVVAVCALLDPLHEIHSRVSEFCRILNNSESVKAQFQTLASSFKPRAAAENAPIDQPPTPIATVSILKPDEQR